VWTKAIDLVLLQARGTGDDDGRNPGDRARGGRAREMLFPLTPATGPRTPRWMTGEEPISRSPESGLEQARGPMGATFTARW